MRVNGLMAETAQRRLRELLDKKFVDGYNARKREEIDNRLATKVGCVIVGILIAVIFFAAFQWVTG